MPSGGAGGVVGGNSLAGNGGATGSDGAAGVAAGGTISAGSGGSVGLGGTTSGGSGGVARGGNGGTTGGTVGLGGTTSGGSGGTARGGSGGTTGGSVGLGGTTSGGSGGTARGGSGGTTGGSVGLGGATSGGSGGVGGAGRGGTAGGGSGGLGGSIVATGDAGWALSDYCSGDANKLDYLGQDLSPPATNCPSAVGMDCCDGFGVNLHTLAPLGFDLALDIVVQVGNVPPGRYSIGLGTSSFRSVSMRRAGSTTAPTPVAMAGTLTTSGSFYGSAAWDVGLCLESQDGSTRVYVPHVTMIPFGMRSRFQIFRLADQSITPTQAQATSLDSLVLADVPLLDLGAIDYVEQSTDNIGTSSASTIGSSLRGPSSGVPLSGSPFVVKVDGAPIYLGTFFRLVSSMMPVGPIIIVDNITSNIVPISAPVKPGNDPRFDPRIVAALSETGKLVP